MKPKQDKKPGKAILEKQYFDEARSWDVDKTDLMQRSHKRAWRFVGVLSVIVILEAVALASLAPLKTVEPFVIRVDNNTGMVDVVSNLIGTAGDVDEKAKDILDKFWLGQYIRHREAYLWETRDYNRNLVGLMSGASVQQSYATYTSPRHNPNAPVTIYGKNTEVEVNLKGISFFSPETVDGEVRKTALVRYTKEVHRKGERGLLTHWSATVTFVYLNSPMSMKDRELNPLGFQVIKYRNDQESVGS